MRHPWQLLRRLRSHFSLSSPSQTNTPHSIPPSHPVKLQPLPPNPNPSPDFSGDSIAAAAVLERSATTRINNQLELNDDVVSSLLSSLESSPDVAKRVFDSISSKEEDGKVKLGSKSYDQMLCVFGANGDVSRFWGMMNVMDKRGYGVSRRVYDRAMERFVSEGLASDAEKLRDVFAYRFVDGAMAKCCGRFCEVVKDDEKWSEESARRITEMMNVEFSREFVRMVVRRFKEEPEKALGFFRWVEVAGRFKNDAVTYNAVARVLARKECMGRFWEVVKEMRSNGIEVETGMYMNGFVRFVKKKEPLLENAVDSYVFALVGTDNPSWSRCTTCTFLLKRIVIAKELNMGLFTRVVRIYRESGQRVTGSMFDSVFLCLRSVGRLGECYKVYRAMERGGLVASRGLRSRIAYTLGKAGNEGEANEFINVMLEAGGDPGYKVWSSLIVGYCVAGHLEKASDCLQKMIKREGDVSLASGCFNPVVRACCRKSVETDARKLVSGSEWELKPAKTTPKRLIQKLLSRREFRHALHILNLMHKDGYPHFIDPFIDHLSNYGTRDDAVAFIQMMASNIFPSINLFLRVFKAYFKSGRRSEAQDFLSMCPGDIRNHADILDLFAPDKSGEDVATNVVVS